MLNPQEEYTRIKSSCEKELSQKKKLSTSLSLIRLGVFISFIVSMYFIFATTTFYVISLLQLVAFLFLVKRHQKVSERIEWLKSKIQIIENEINAIHQNYSSFDPGMEYTNHSHAYSSDLDVFGKGSLFQILNRTNTPHGKDALSNWLIQLSSNKKIISRQEAVKGFEKETNLQLDFKATGEISNISHQDIKNIISWSKSESSKTYPIYLSFITFIALIASSLLAYYGLVHIIVPLIVFSINMGLTGKKVKEINHVHASLSKQNSSLKRITQLLGYIKDVKNPQGRIKEINEELNRSHADVKIKSLFEIISMFDSRLNLVVSTVFNGTILYDNLVVSKLNTWKEESGNDIENWIGMLGEFDALVSLSTFSHNHPEFNFPEIKEEYTFKAKNLYHPLLPKDSRIGNDFSVDKDNDLFLITGSNMAGKSTFLRSVGTNMLLAQVGTRTCSESFEYSPFEIYTSMRIFDSVQSGASTFFAEVNRIKGIIDAAKEKRIFILLDEILKGTNSKDKFIGSKALIVQLSKFQTSGIIATHDIALGELEEKYENIHNRRFEVEIKNGDFIFDYKMKEGVCQTMNATELMKKMGIEIFE